MVQLSTPATLATNKSIRWARWHIWRQLWALLQRRHPPSLPPPVPRQSRHGQNFAWRVLSKIEQGCLLAIHMLNCTTAVSLSVVFELPSRYGRSSSTAASRLRKRKPIYSWSLTCVRQH